MSKSPELGLRSACQAHESIGAPEGNLRLCWSAICYKNSKQREKKKSTYSPLLKKNHQCKLEREKVAEEVVVSQPFWEFAMGSALQPLVPTGEQPLWAASLALGLKYIEKPWKKEIISLARTWGQFEVVKAPLSRLVGCSDLSITLSVFKWPCLTGKCYVVDPIVFE